MHSIDYDVAIIGGGAAGLSAALVLGRTRRRIVVIDAGAPRNAPAAHMHGFLSRDGLPPEQLLEVGRAEARRYGVELLDDEAVSAGPGLAVRLASGGTVHARRLVLATGAVDELPEIPGARERWGRDFLHCPYCHGWEVRDQPLGVLGTVAGAVEHAHLLRQWSDDVVYFSHTHPATDDERAALRARGIDVVDGLVGELLVVDDRLTGVRLDDGREIARAAVFMRPTLRPGAQQLLDSLVCEVEASGFVRVDSDGRTSVPGVWCAGNAANPRAQVITAAGEGSAVAIAINNDLVQEDIR